MTHLLVFLCSYTRETSSNVPAASWGRSVTRGSLRSLSCAPRTAIIPIPYRSTVVPDTQNGPRKPKFKREGMNFVFSLCLPTEERLFQGLRALLRHHCSLLQGKGCLCHSAAPLPRAGDVSSPGYPTTHCSRPPAG